MPHLHQVIGVNGKKCPLRWSVGRMSLRLVVGGKNVSLRLVVGGKNVPYIGDQWEECPLHWGSVGRVSITLGGQWEECPLRWWSVGRMSLTLGVSGKNVPYIGDQWEECPLHW
ncbi:unnamed protein product [Staurois parvus]|uniref:Uncharacterized protein n=1 Tax=Staurois parvus TaxID=386267 RepID=A0ABN9EI17_9NEOB|nr:unnamed protein product [Staurois parvus]